MGLTMAEQLDYVCKSKSIMCQEVGVDLLIDDSLQSCLECAALGIDILLFDFHGKYSYNHIKEARRKRTLTSTSKQLYHRTQAQSLPSNVKRISDWKGIKACFPKPTSPLRICHFPNEDDQDDLTLIEDDQDNEGDSPHIYSKRRYADAWPDSTMVFV
jgi:hypothetical protein